MRLGYNCDNDRYGILDMDLWVDDGLHCGETFEAYINGEWIAERIEMNPSREWYLVYSKLKGDELEYVKVRRR